MMAMHFINHLGNRGADYLHPGGKRSSDYVVSEIWKRNPSTVLEIGCGTGATLVSLVAKNIHNVYGVDISPSQVDMAKKRLGYCNIEHAVHVELIDPSCKLRFQAGMFDAVFAESVLGILAHQDLVQILREIRRVLKPNGLLICNDAIWKRGVSKQTAESINFRTTKDFGLIQSSAALIGREKWMEFFEASGFSGCQVIEVVSLPTSKEGTNHQLEVLSSEFTKKQKIQAYLQPKLFMKEMWYRIKLKLLHRNDGNNLENLIFVVTKQ